ncbi:hypothetical protein HYT58_00225 [Candidatus Woesearchaeota archaeon]|nr:hypothetical protein [Candidatus Woesearchaeota archaeon]
MRFGFEKVVMVMIILVLIAGFLSGALNGVTGKAVEAWYKVYPYTIDLGGGEKLITDHLILESNVVLKDHQITLCKGNCITFKAEDNNCANQYMCSYDIPNAYGNTITADVDGKRVAPAGIQDILVYDDSKEESPMLQEYCEDSDGGYNPIKDGKVKITIKKPLAYGYLPDENHYYADSCLFNNEEDDEGSLLKEYFCKGSSVADKIVECECAFSRCIREEEFEVEPEELGDSEKWELARKWREATIKEREEQQIVKSETSDKKKPTCEDSDEGSIDTSTVVRGKVSGADADGNGFEYWDECINDKTLKEWLCSLDGNEYVPDSVEIDCESCKDAICEPPEDSFWTKLIRKIKGLLTPETELDPDSWGALGRKG